jgi:glycerol kinase
MILDRGRNILSSSYEKLELQYPDGNKVEQSGEEIYSKTIDTMRGAVKNAGVSASDIKCIGISTQRVTWMLWDRESGNPVMNMCTWLDRRGIPVFNRLKADGGFEKRFPQIHAALQPQQIPCSMTVFLDANPEIRQNIDQGKIMFGTVDTWVVYKLTKGRVFASSASNASTTRMVDHATFMWNRALLDYLKFPVGMFPEIKDEADDYGCLDKEILGAEIPITGVAADQQSALFAQGCVTPFSVKSTNGTGSFVTFNLGDKDLGGQGSYSSIAAWKLKDQVRYMAEGFLPTSGAALEWALNNMRLISSFDELSEICARVPDSNGVFFSPALNGFRAPLNDATARAGFFGISGGTTREHCVRAMMESIAFANAHIIEDIQKRFKIEKLNDIKLSGGVARTPLLGQMIADITDTRVEQHASLESSVIGAANFAGIGIGMFDLDDVTKDIKVTKTYVPDSGDTYAKKTYAAWKDAILRTTDWNTIY